MTITNITKTTSNHNWFMVSTNLVTIYTDNFLLIGAEVTTKVWTTKLVIKCSGTDWPFNHNIVGRCYSPWLAVFLLPWHYCTRDFQIRNRETSKSSFRLRTLTSCTLITNLTTRTGSSTRER